MARVKADSRRKQLQKPTGAAKPRRFKPGTVANREIRRYQKSTGFLLKKAPFSRVVRDIARDPVINISGANIRFKKEAMVALQEAAEEYLVGMLKYSQCLALHAGRQTIKRQDMGMWKLMKTTTAETLNIDEWQQLFVRPNKPGPRSAKYKGKIDDPKNIYEDSTLDVRVPRVSTKGAPPPVIQEEEDTSGLVPETDDASSSEEA